ncbi:MAG: hypothetical protein ACOYJL_08835 [Tractidigestivibacter sp.]|jgi:glycine cleavage system aminomethyltransferase T|uniref:hypothetical protein n=1 Tax=Tractidigestivibacter sp. TaxID=2847320 RepID=UPI003D8E199B
MFEPDGNINSGALMLMPFFPYMSENPKGKYMGAFYTGPRDELLAARNTAWLGYALCASPVYDVWGPDLCDLLNRVCVNRDFKRLKIGGSRHALFCNDRGQLLADGVLMRLDENLYRSYWLAPVLSFYVEVMAPKWGLDVHGKWITNDFFIQIDGPKSLQIMEKAAHKDLHHLKFAQHDHIEIAGQPVTIHRLGMSGCLAYEMHGDMKYVEDVYGAIYEAGKEFGIRKLSWPNYTLNHTQGGYPNQWIHFRYPLGESGEELKKYWESIPETKWGAGLISSFPATGSAADVPDAAYVTPFDVGWDYLINWDHDFVGKDALAEIAKNPPRKPVTLEWNAEDVGKVFAQQLTNSAVDPRDDISNVGDNGANFKIHKVMKDGKLVGIASGRIVDFYHHQEISLCWLDSTLAELGTEVTVIWGTTPGLQSEIRAKVAPFPYYNEEMRNETFDVEKIPHPNFD